MSSLIIPKTIIESFLDHAQNDYPYECCGLILGEFRQNSSTALKYIPVENIKKEERERRFLIDPMEYEKAEDEADKHKLSIISIIHSHPDHPDRPSEFDKNHAWPGFSYIIISVIKGKSQSFKSWQLDKDRMLFIEEKINIIN